MNRLLPISLISLLFFVLVSPTYAITTTPSEAPVLTKEATRVQAKTDKTTSQVSNLQERATLELERRLAALNDAVKKIANMKKLSSAEKATLTTQVQAEITTLTSLKAKIAADTDIEVLKTDVKSIVSSYRIFALFLPKINLLASADVLGSTIDSLTVVSTKLDARITEAQAAGKSVTSLKTTLSHMQEKLADAKRQYESIVTNVTPLTPDGYPGNKTTLTNARELLQTGRKDLVDAAKDARTIMTSLKAFRPEDKAASSSASPTTTRE